MKISSSDTSACTPAFPDGSLPPRNMRKIASTLLAMVTLLWLGLLCLHHYYPIADRWMKMLDTLINTGLEAAIVGGLADWYAITVLFHNPWPKKLPLPDIIREHTEIIPRNKNRIARELAHFAQEHFLAPAQLKPALTPHDLSAVFAKKLLNDKIIRSISNELRQIFIKLLETLEDPKVEMFLRTTIIQWCQTIDLKKLVGEGFTIVTDNGIHKDALQWGLLQVDTWISSHRTEIKNKLKVLLDASTMAPLITLARVFTSPEDKIVTELLENVRKIITTPDHPLRQDLDRFMDEYNGKLRRHHSNEQLALEALRSKLLNSEEVSTFVTQVLRNLCDRLRLDLMSKNPELLHFLEKTVKENANRLLAEENSEVRQLINQRLCELAVHYSEDYSNLIVSYINNIIMKWDGLTLAGIIEEKVGNDLYAIRINGVLMGFAIGCFLGLVNLLFHH